MSLRTMLDLEGCAMSTDHDNYRFLPTLKYVQSNDHGFTLIELLMVCAIIGVLATLSINGYQIVRERAKHGRCMGEIYTLSKDIIAYAAERGTYPPNLAAVGRVGLMDPWNHPYVYSVTPGRTNIGTPINTDFDIYSVGPDGDSADSITDDVSLDDIIRGNDGTFVEQASKYFLL